MKFQNICSTYIWGGKKRFTAIHIHQWLSGIQPSTSHTSESAGNSFSFWEIHFVTCSSLTLSSYRQKAAIPMPCPSSSVKSSVPVYLHPHQSNSWSCCGTNCSRLESADSLHQFMLMTSGALPIEMWVAKHFIIGWECFWTAVVHYTQITNQCPVHHRNVTFLHCSIPQTAPLIFLPDLYPDCFLNCSCQQGRIFRFVLVASAPKLLWCKVCVAAWLLWEAPCASLTNCCKSVLSDSLSLCWRAC